MRTPSRYALAGILAGTVLMSSCGTRPAEQPAAAPSLARAGAAPRFGLLAIALTATASHTRRDLVAPRTVDNNLNTDWQSGTVSNPWLRLDSGESAGVEGIRVRGKPRIGTFDVEVSADGVSYRTVLRTQRLMSWNVEFKPFPSGTTARYIRLRFANSNQNVLIYEVTPRFAPASPSPAPTPTPAPTATPTPAASPTTTPPPEPTPTPTPIPTMSPTPMPVSASITVDANQVLHAASPYTMGFNRNHSHRQFAKQNTSRQAMIDAVRALTPRWGHAWLRDQAAAGYPARSAPSAIYRPGHAPTDGRSNVSYMGGFFFQQMWNLDGQAITWDGYPYDDLRYALDEAEEMGAEPLVTVNFGSDTAESAGALAGYLNGAEDALRAAYPFSAPPFSMGSDGARGAYLFEIGNEIQFPTVIGHSKANTIDEYVANARAYVEAIRGASPHPVKIALDAAVNTFWGGPTTNGDAWLQRGDMIRGFIRSADTHGVRFEALQCHLYPTYPVREKLAGVAYTENLFRSTLIPAMGTRDFEFWNDEFHAATGSTTRNPGLYGALYAADTTVLAFRLSRGGKQLIPITVDFAMWHAGSGNNYDSIYFQNNSAANRTPVYHFRRLLASRFGDHVLATHTSDVGSWTDTATNGELTVVSNLHAVGAKSGDGRTVHVLVVNRSQTPVTSHVRLEGFSASRCLRSRIEATVTPSWDAAWNQVQVTEDVPVPVGEPVEFPAGSITFLRFEP